MITLSTPPAVKSVLGGNTLVNYDKFVLSQITYEPVTLRVSGSVRLTSTASPEMTPLLGSFVIVGSILEITVKDLDFYRRVTLSGAQNTTVLGYITAAQNQLESGMVGLGIVAGTQATGA